MGRGARGLGGTTMTPDELARVRRYIDAVRHDDTLTGLLARYALALLQRIEDGQWT